MYSRPVPWHYWLTAFGLVALLLGGMAFALGLASTSSSASHAAQEAKTASTQAQDAAQSSKIALGLANKTIMDLCTLLDVIQRDGIDEAHAARLLYDDFNCASILHH